MLEIREYMDFSLYEIAIIGILQLFKWGRGWSLPQLVLLPDSGRDAVHFGGGDAGFTRGRGVDGAEVGTGDGRGDVE